jgi:hypothetical protein
MIFCEMRNFSLGWHYVKHSFFPVNHSTDQTVVAIKNPAITFGVNG